MTFVLALVIVAIIVSMASAIHSMVVGHTAFSLLMIALLLANVYNLLTLITG